MDEHKLSLTPLLPFEARCAHCGTHSNLYKIKYSYGDLEEGIVICGEDYQKLVGEKVDRMVSNGTN